MNDPNVELRASISRLMSWIEVTFRRLSSLHPNKLTYNKWIKLVAEYYIDTLNGDGSEATRRDATRILSLRTAKKIGCDFLSIESVFEETRTLPYKTLSMRKNKVLLARYPKVHSKDIEALSLRYHLLLKSSGHFLSMDRELYRELLCSSRLPVLECYASPFNHNLTHYCSLFPEDELFGACPRFDELVDWINFPCRLIANPPYTVKSINKFVEKIMAYMKRQRGEFIALLPHLEGSARMEELLSSENTAHAILPGETYLLHDFLTRVDITVPMVLYIVVNVECSYMRSAKMVSHIAHRLRTRAEALLKKRADKDVDKSARAQERRLS